MGNNDLRKPSPNLFVSNCTPNQTRVVEKDSKNRPMVCVCIRCMSQHAKSLEGEYEMDFAPKKKTHSQKVHLQGQVGRFVLLLFHSFSINDHISFSNDMNNEKIIDIFRTFSISVNTTYIEPQIHLLKDYNVNRSVIFCFILFFFFFLDRGAGGGGGGGLIY